nr:MAG TPA: hypothetical protein [Caudoviricetes sp.]
MTYTVIRPFKDMRDEEQHEYKIDDVFPRKGYEPDQEFVKGLLTGFNSAGSIFITDEVVKKATEEVEENTEEVKEATEEVEETTEEAKEATEEVEEATEEKPKRKKATKKEEE